MEILTKDDIINSSNGLAIDLLNQFEKSINKTISKIEKSIQKIKKSITERAKKQKFKGDDCLLFDLGADDLELFEWSNELREFHLFDLGMLDSLEYNKKLIENLKIS